MADPTATDAANIIDIFDDDNATELDKYLPPGLKEAIDTRRKFISKKGTEHQRELQNGGGYSVAVQEFTLPGSLLKDTLDFSVRTSQPEPTPGAKPALFKQELDPETFRHLNCRVYYLHLNLFKPLWKHRDRSSQDPVVRLRPIHKQVAVAITCTAFIPRHSRSCSAWMRRVRRTAAPAPAMDGSSIAAAS